MHEPREQDRPGAFDEADARARAAALRAEPAAFDRARRAGEEASGVVERRLGNGDYAKSVRARHALILASARRVARRDAEALERLGKG